MAKYTFLFLSLCLLVFSCKEEPIIIPPLGQSGAGNTGTNLKNVLVEEITGVKCVNCPDGAIVIEELKAKYKERLVAVSIHAGFFAKKLAESKYDLKNTVSVNVYNFLGSPDGNPAAIFNRKPLGLNGSLAVLSKEQWAGIAQQESSEKAKATLLIEKTFNEATRELKVTTTITPLETLTGEYHLSVMLTESNIIDAQLKTTGVVSDYKHNHVLRDMLTTYDGLLLTDALSANAKIKKEFTYTVPANFNAKECEIVAVFHKAGTTKEVLQAASQKVQ